MTNARSMTSNAIRGIRRKKSSLCEVKVAVIGAPGVGKSGGYNALSLNCGYSYRFILYERDQRNEI